MAKSSGASKTNQAANYKASKAWERNRRRRLEKLMLEHPNNKQIESALTNIVYRRGTPKTRFWSKTRIKVAGLFKRFVGKVDVNIFNNNEKVSVPAHFTKGPHSNYKHEAVPEKQMFKLASRVRTGNLLWN